MQQYILEHFYGKGENGFMKNAPMGLFNKTDCFQSLS